MARLFLGTDVFGDVKGKNLLDSICHHAILAEKVQRG